MWNAGVSHLRLTSTSSELQCVLKLCAVQYVKGLVLFAALPCLWPFLHFSLPLNHSQLRSTVTIESLHSNHLVLAITVMLPRSLAQCTSYSSLSRCASLVNTTCLFVSSISPARNTSSRIAYTYTHQPHPSQHPSIFPHIPCKS
jgi:hypothetical protein